MLIIIVSYYFGTNVLLISLCSQIHFLEDHHCKTQSESFDALENCRDCLMFLQGDKYDRDIWQHL